jgi:1-acyl-sn-glycerol-3-phosphate acyltransferase
MKIASCGLLHLIEVVLFALIVRPFLLVFMGLAVRHRENLPKQGPAIIVANHNSHLDTLSLMAQLPLSALRQVRPVAARDHFGHGAVGFFTRFILQSVLVERHSKQGMRALDPVLDVLDEDNIVIFFPEGCAAILRCWDNSDTELPTSLRRDLTYRLSPSICTIPENACREVQGCLCLSIAR